MSATEEHKHTWQATMHLDHCHYYTNAYVCGGKGPPKKCGATAAVHRERNPKSLSAGFWLDSENCKRCQELIDGAPYHTDLVICDKDGNVIEEKHATHEQAEEPEEEEADDGD